MNSKLEYLVISLLGFLLISSNLTGQGIIGEVIDSQSDSALAYVNIGVIDLPVGTVSNESGKFELTCANLPQDSKVRISMIGYESQTFAWSDLLNDYDTIRLVRKVIELDEVVVTWRDHIRTVGTTRITKGGGVCGWGGTDFGRGHELGLLMELGDETVKIEGINLKVHKQSFDTVVFRLHIRSIENGLPSVELLTENIYLPLFEQSGWQKADLSDYKHHIFQILILGYILILFIYEIFLK